MKKCQVCGKSNIEIGMLEVGVGGLHLHDATPVRFRSQDKKKELKSVYSSVCNNCGHIDIYADPKQLKTKD